MLQIGDRFIPESNAACFYLAEGSSLLPGDRFDRADMLRWMFFEQYNHEPNIATMRFWKDWLGFDRLTEAQRLQIPLKRQAGSAALKLMDEHLLGGIGWSAMGSASRTFACSPTPTSPTRPISTLRSSCRGSLDGADHEPPKTYPDGRLGHCLKGGAKRDQSERVSATVLAALTVGDVFGPGKIGHTGDHDGSAHPNCDPAAG